MKKFLEAASDLSKAVMIENLALVTGSSLKLSLQANKVMYPNIPNIYAKAAKDNKEENPDKAVSNEKFKNWIKIIEES